MNRARVTTVILSVAALAVAGVFTATTAGAEQMTRTFDQVGTYEFVVPANVCEVAVDAFGAQGGPGRNYGNTADAGPAGLGGRARATITVTPGEVLQVNVGGRGLNGFESPTGGFNGGGAGGQDDANAYGGHGGGASDVRQGGTDFLHRVVVAGGGGGGGAVVTGDATPGGGGGGGGIDGDNGADGVRDVEPDPIISGGGKGGSPTQGGAGGIGFATTGGDGMLGQGGAGAEASAGGGGGGGGLFGGGGGAGGDDGGGGGGGSGKGSTFETGVRSGDGLVVLSYDPASNPCGTGDTSSDETVKVPVPMRFTG